MATKRTLIGNIKGPKGDPGEQGLTGPVGPGATIEVGTVSTTAYGNTAQVTNSGTETAAVLDFVIPQGKPGEQTTKMSGLTLDTVTASTVEYPIPATGDTGSVAWGKVIKFFNDAKTAIASKINISDIVNNLTSTATNKPLSAAQGKALNDAFAWKLAGSAMGTNTVTIPAGWKEANIRIALGGTRYFFRNVASENFNFGADTSYDIRDGYYADTGNSAYISFGLNTKTSGAAIVSMISATLTGNNILSTTSIQIWYR